MLLCGCAQSVQSPSRSEAGDAGLRHLGTTVVQRQPSGHLAQFGGISGMDYDPMRGVWYLLSDDRSEFAPARFYTAMIPVDESGIGPVDVTGVVTIEGLDGAPLPNETTGGDVPDPEALRVDPRGGSLFWSSEGSRNLGLDAFVREARRDGRFVSTLPLPGGLHIHRDVERGPRHNRSLEGIAFTPDGSALWLAMETPLYEDGPLPSMTAGALTRFTKVDRQGKVLAQFAYPLDPIPVAAVGGRQRADNGVSEILSIDDSTLLVVERAGHEVEEMVFKFSVRIYEANFAMATDVAALPSLAEASVVPMAKRLILDLNRSGLGEIDNIEAAAWGPRLRNGHRTLVIASDDNFSPRQMNQFMAFEVISPSPPARR